MKKLGVNERVTHCVSHFFVEVPAAYPLPLSCNIVFALNPSDAAAAATDRDRRQANAFHVFKRRVFLSPPSPSTRAGIFKACLSVEGRRGEERGKKPMIMTTIDATPPSAITPRTAP